MIRAMWRILFLSFGLLAACTGFPALDGKVSATARAAAYPKLLPINDLLTRPSPPRLSETDVAALTARAARLRRRAAALRGPVVDQSTRKRLASSVSSSVAK